MRRGEIWTIAGGSEYTTKPRPVVIVQDTLFDSTDSVTVCSFTSDPRDLLLFRVVVEPTEQNGLQTTSRIMVDKIISVRRHRLRRRIGHLDSTTVSTLNQALLVFLGLGSSNNDRP